MSDLCKKVRLSCAKRLDYLVLKGESYLVQKGETSAKLNYRLVQKGVNILCKMVRLSSAKRVRLSCAKREYLVQKRRLFCAKR